MRRFEVFFFSTMQVVVSWATLRQPSVAQVISLWCVSEYKFYATIKTFNVNLTIGNRRW